MRIVGNNPQLSRQTQGTASGAITGGKPVIVNTDGTVSEISEVTQAIGTEVVFESATTPHKGITFDSSNNRIVIAYRDGGNSNYGTAVVGTVSGTSISFGTPVTFDTGGTIDPIEIGFDSNSNKVVIAYRDGGDSDKGKAIVGTVDSSDNSISFGSEAEFNGGNTGYINVVFDSSNNKIVIVYTDYGNSSYGTAIVGTVSGTSISFGSEVVFESAASYYVGASFDSSNNKIVVAYSDDGNSGHGTAIVGTVSGTSISFGTAAVFNAANTTSGFAINFPVVFDSSNNKIVIAYADEGAGGDGFAIVGTVSGTSISFGSEVEFHNDDIYGVAGVFDPSSNKVVISYGDENNSTHGKFILGTVSGTSISFETAATFASATTTYLVSTIDTNSNRVVNAYHDTGNSNYGTAIVLRPAVATNITSENFIGFAEDTVATGQPVTINTKGAIADNIPQIASASSSVGTAVTFDSSSSTRIASCYDSTNNRIVVSYVDTGSDDDGTVAVGTVNASDNSISWGTPVAFNSNVKITDSSIVHDSNSNKIVIGYMDEDNSNYGTGIVGTIDTSDNSISFGSPTVYESASIATSSRNFGVFDSNSNKVIFGYQDDADSNKGKAVVGTVSGTSISFGSPVIFETGYAIHMDATFDTSNNKVVIAYRDYGNSDYGTAVVGTVSGTSISFGTPVVYNSAESDWNSAAFDSSNNKVVISYQDKGNSSVGTAIVGTVSGTSISFGSEVVYSSGTATYTYATFDSNLNKVIIGYRNDASSDRGDFVIGTVSGTSISFNSPATFESDAVTWVRAAFDSSAKRTVFTFNEDNSAGKGVVMQPAGILEDIIPAQTYFVQTDGTLSQTADDPSVTAGTAVAGSTLIVKG